MVFYCSNIKVANIDSSTIECAIVTKLTMLCFAFCRIWKILQLWFRKTVVYKWNLIDNSLKSLEYDSTESYADYGGTAQQNHSSDILEKKKILLSPYVPRPRTSVNLKERG